MIAFRLLTLIAVGCIIPMSAPARATSVAENLSAQCYSSQELDRYRLLRRLSLDLRQQLPSYEEYLALDDESDIPKALIDDWLASDAFRQTMRRFHEDLLWPSLNGVSLTDVNARIAIQNARYVLLGQGRKRTFRGGNGTQTCGNFEQTEFNPDGSPIPREETTPDGLPFQQDGWVWVEPYWAPGTQVQVCAFDAQAASVGQFADCATLDGMSDPKCGCGPNLRHCYGEGAESAFRDDMREQLGRLVDDIAVGGRPYSELVTTRRQWVNGRYEFWRKYMGPMVSINKTWNVPGPGDAPTSEAPSFSDLEWRLVERSGHHAGVQTMPAFLLRFQTNRSRANRFRTVFTSQYFVPAEGAAAEGCSDDTTDLTNRCVCQTCHQVLEPLAAHFAEFVEAGLSAFDHDIYPVNHDTCANLEQLPEPQRRRIAATCRRFYVMEDGEPNIGTLIPWQYADGDGQLHQTIAANIASGPLGLGESTIASGLFHTSTVRNMFRFLMGRDMNLDPTDALNELDLLSDIATEFQVHDDLTQLVATLIDLPQYRRIR